MIIQKMFVYSTIRQLLELIINRHHFTKYYCCSLASENLVCGLIYFAGKTLFSVLNVYSFYAGKMKKLKLSIVVRTITVELLGAPSLERGGKLVKI
jgi:hypothetical protein